MKLWKESETNIFLTGFMASGKTTVGKQLAKKLNRTFVDTDAYIEKKTGMSIPAIFEKWGEKRFRELESELIRSLCKNAGKNRSKKRALVVSLGGGTLIDDKNQKRVLKNGILIYLRVSPSEVLSRLKKLTSSTKNSRPLIKGSVRGVTIAKVRRLLSIRMPGYTKSKICIQTNHKKPSEIVRLILMALPPSDSSGS